MLLQALHPVLYTDQMQESIDFYTMQLGFTCVERNDKWVWAVLHKDEVEIMLSTPNEHIPFTKPQFTGSFNIRTDDKEGLWNQLKDKVKIVYPIETFEWNMREFAIHDNNGYVIQFGQEL